MARSLISREVHHLEAALESIGSFHDDVSQASLSELMENASCNRIMELFQAYLASLRGGHISITQIYSCLVSEEMRLMSSPLLSSWISVG